ncbi:hypothetical protein [Pseudonocardia sp. D17]|uniref:hypothetical protein n=1 Tax=Pseudonocardia sp. D17 TaxID=882661 RepID=UPI002B3766C5|nr:hypothetical protein PSD17_39340 [Pseudonocardia sp. D17]
MSTTDERPVPGVEADTAAVQLDPGAPAARIAGCICPAWINGYGAGVRTGPGRIDPITHLAHPACRLHGVL